MNKSDVVIKVNELMQKGFELPIEKLVPEANLFQDLGLDSLDTVDMLVHLEENLKVRVDNERIMKVRTLQDIYDLVFDLAHKAPRENIQLEVSN